VGSYFTENTSSFETSFGQYLGKSPLFIVDIRRNTKIHFLSQGAGLWNETSRWYISLPLPYIRLEAYRTQPEDRRSRRARRKGPPLHVQSVRKRPTNSCQYSTLTAGQDEHDCQRAAPHISQWAASPTWPGSVILCRYDIFTQSQLLSVLLGAKSFEAHDHSLFSTASLRSQPSLTRGRVYIL
jgi:hypothetical protein